MVNLTYETLHQNNSPFSKPTETDLIRQASKEKTKTKKQVGPSSYEIQR